jgi:nucleoside 2-deoxyribosyltransferase
MKIYFGFTVAGSRSSLEAAREIVAVLVEMGHEVLTSHLIRDDAREADRRISPKEVYERDMNWLRECDVFIGEVSGSTFGLGFEAGYLLGATAKPVLLFYAKEHEDRISLLIVGNSHPNCRLSAYSKFEEIKALIAMNFAQLGFSPPSKST